MNKLMTVLLALLVGPYMFAQQIDGGTAIVGTSAEAVKAVEKVYVPSESNLRHREAFNDYRFGVFIHWGISSMFAQGVWYQSTAGISSKEYSKAAGGFYPASFNAREWVKSIKAAGAKYICFTTRHHDGFSMFETKHSEYDIIDATPYKRDILKELADACHEEGIDLHLYYSLIDWWREDYPTGRSAYKSGKDPQKANYDTYCQFMKDQLTELLTNYGNVGCIWFDGVWDQKGPVPFDWKLDEIYSHIHSIRPECLIINNHHLLPFDGEDAQVFEQDMPGRNTTGRAGADRIGTLPLESCITMNNKWGYVVTDQNYKSQETLIKLLVETASNGVNLLLNVGPQPNGCIPETALDRLAGIGEWMKVYGESIYDTDASGIPAQSWGRTTRRDKVIYMHVLEPLEGNLVVQLPVDRKVKSVTVLKDGAPLKYKVKDGVLSVTLTEKPTDVDYVMKVELK